MDTNGNLLVIAGNLENGFGLLALTSFDGYFDVVDKVELDMPVVTIKRLLNNDLFVVAMSESLAIYGLKDTTLSCLFTFDSLTLEDVKQIAFSDNNLLVLQQNGCLLTHVQFVSSNLDDL